MGSSQSQQDKEEQQRRALLLHVARSGDACGPCRARVMSVMEGAVRNGFEERHLPDYMQSFCEVRLAITGPIDSFRSPDDISRICNAFKANLAHDLEESVEMPTSAGSQSSSAVDWGQHYCTID